MTIERRHDHRYALDRPIKVQFDQTGGRYLPGQSVNISSGGIMLKVDYARHLQLGQEVRLAIANHPRQALLAADDAIAGTVVRCLGHSDTQHVAVRFHKPNLIAEAC